MASFIKRLLLLQVGLDVNNFYEKTFARFKVVTIAIVLHLSRETSSVTYESYYNQLTVNKVFLATIIYSKCKGGKI